MSLKPHFLTPLLRGPGPAHHLVIDRSGIVLAKDLELAADSHARNRGLLGRSGIGEGSAMIIAPCSAVHTFFMRFTIDVVFADRNGRVVKLNRHVKPWRIGLGLRGFAAIELAAGSIDRSGVAEGDKLSVTQN